MRHIAGRAPKLKSVCLIFCLTMITLRYLSACDETRQVALAQDLRPDKTKESKDQKKPSSGFEDDQSAMCLSATQQAKLVAAVVESYSRRLGACVTSNPNFRDDCYVEFGRVVKSYNQYQTTVSTLRNYCK